MRAEHGLYPSDFGSRVLAYAAHVGCLDAGREASGIGSSALERLLHELGHAFCLWGADHADWPGAGRGDLSDTISDGLEQFTNVRSARAYNSRKRIELFHECAILRACDILLVSYSLDNFETKHFSFYETFIDQRHEGAIGVDEPADWRLWVRLRRSPTVKSILRFYEEVVGKFEPPEWRAGLGLCRDRAPGRAAEGQAQKTLTCHAAMCSGLLTEVQKMKMREKDLINSINAFMRGVNRDTFNAEEMRTNIAAVWKACGVEARHVQNLRVVLAPDRQHAPIVRINWLPLRDLRFRLKPADAVVPYFNGMVGARAHIATRLVLDTIDQPGNMSALHKAISAAWAMLDLPQETLNSLTVTRKRMDTRPGSQADTRVEVRYRMGGSLCWTRRRLPPAGPARPMEETAALPQVPAEAQAKADAVVDKALIAFKPWPPIEVRATLIAQVPEFVPPEVLARRRAKGKRYTVGQRRELACDSGWD